jgi:short-subunit dehydrogenase
MVKTVLVIGATSAMAKETCKHFAKEKARFFLVARDANKLGSVKLDLLTRGAESVTTCALDLADFSEYRSLVSMALKELGRIDITLIAHGVLPDQKQAQKEFKIAEESIRINFLSVIALCEILAEYYENQQAGCLAVISSVAGDRGRASNYIYGAAKGGLTRYLQGLWQRLAPSHVNVVIIKPGFVESPMTQHLQGGGPLWATADTAGRAIYKAIIKGKPVAYIPAFWKGIMWGVIHTPHAIFKRVRF